jgi:hypothetical protein
MDGIEKEKDEIFGRAVRAGRRTYFFDVKSTKGGDYYITVTESKKRFVEDGKFVYDKHKIFLYKEDFEKFLVTLNEAVDFVKAEQPFDPESFRREQGESGSAGYADVNFEDLDH